MYTEEEAKQKWCPFARTAIGGVDLEHVVVNRTALGYGDAEEHRCIASQCMAWRWNSSGTTLPEPHPDGGYCMRFPHDTEPRGECGLAGAPS